MADIKWLIPPSPIPVPIGLETHDVGKEVYDRIKQENIQKQWVSVGQIIFISTVSAEPPINRVAGDEPALVLSIANSGLTGPDQTLLFDVLQGGSTFTGPEVFLTGFQVGYSTEENGFVPYWSVSGLGSLTMSELVNILTDSDAIYDRYTALFDSDTNATGSALDDRFDLGAGDDIINAGAGDDTVFRWKAGDLDYRGGAGRDILYFQTDFGDQAFPNAFAQKLVVDLAQGKGKNPYGGDLVLKSVEVIHDTPRSDRISGSKASETVVSDFGGADIFRLKGGNDLVTLFSGFNGTLYDGGNGIDRLEVTTSGASDYDPVRGFATQRLNLGDASKSTNDFAGLVVRNVEDVKVNMTRDFVHLDLIGTGAGETLTINNFLARANSLVKIDGKGGNDTANGGFGKDILLGGQGNDALNGNDGDDVIRGGAGIDVLTGGRGNDKLFGNNGADVFVFSDGFGRDRLTGYQDGIDKFDFSGHAGIDAFRDLKVRDTVAGVKILDGDGGRIDLVGIDKVDIDKTDFLF